MKQVVTETQKREIGALSVEHSDALIAMGADLYRQGLIKGAIIGGVTVAAGMTISLLKYAKREVTKETEHY